MTGTRLDEALLTRAVMTTLPDPLIERLHAGAFPVTVWRNHLGLTVNELASRAGISPAELKQIEQANRLRGDRGERIAAGLGVSPCHLRQVRGRYQGCEEAMKDLGEGEWPD